jgi:hypothetical protein
MPNPSPQQPEAAPSSTAPVEAPNAPAKEAESDGLADLHAWMAQEADRDESAQRLLNEHDVGTKPAKPEPKGKASAGAGLGKTKGEQPDTEPESEDEEPEAAAPAETAEPEAPEVTVDALKEMIQAGKMKEALTALGASTGQQVTAAKEADFRARTARVRAKQDEREAAIRKLAADAYAEITAQTNRFAPYVEAEKAMEEGNLVRWLRLASGREDVEEFTSAVIQQNLSKDPERERELERLKRESKQRNEREAAEKRQREEREKSEQSALQARQRRDAVTGLITARDFDDGAAALATKKLPAFVDRVIAINDQLAKDDLEEFTARDVTEKAIEELLGQADYLAGIAKEIRAIRKTQQATGEPEQTPEQPDRDGNPEQRRTPNAGPSHQRAQRSSGGKESDASVRRRLASDVVKAFL